MLKKSTPFYKTKAFKIAVAVFSAVVIFFIGFFVRYITLDKSIRSLIWVKDKIDSDYYIDITDDEFLEAATDGIDSMLDDYSTYYTPDEYSSAMSSSAGNGTGLGISFSGLTYNRIARVGGNTPAERAGIKAGYFVVGYGDDESSITPAESYGGIAAYISGKSVEESFVLAIASDAEGTDTQYYTLQKQSYNENYVFYSSSSTAYRFEGSTATELTQYDGAIEELPSDTAYIRLTRFAGNAATQFKLALDRFKAEGKKNLILDLRTNGGGDMEVLRRITSYLCRDADSTPTAAVARYKDGHSETFKCTGNYFYEYFSSDSKITVLANSGTASASECLIGAMVDYGTIDYSDIILSNIGGTARTYGKGIMQTTYYHLFAGDAVKLTVATVHWPLSDKCIHGVGITEADGARSAPTEDYMTAGDKELQYIIKNYLK